MNKKTFPFKIGCTSYVIPDTILPNVKIMADKVDDIELVLFESQGMSNILDEKTVDQLQQIAFQERVTYSIHFPIDLRAGAINAYEQDKLFDFICSIITSTVSLPVSGYLLHLEGFPLSCEQEMHTTWLQRVTDFCDRLVDIHLVNPSLICIENLGYPPELHSNIVQRCNFSHCIDLGHLWLQQRDWESYVTITLPTTKLIHLHGVALNGKDHHSLTKHANPQQLKRLCMLLKNYTGVVTLEVFSLQDTFDSLSCLEDIWHG